MPGKSTSPMKKGGFKSPSRNSEMSRASKYENMSDADLNKALGKSIGRGGMSSPNKRKNKYTIDRPMTFKEMREQERINEQANIAPGANHIEKKFGDLPNQKVNFGEKYKFVPKEGPAPGTYDPTPAQKHVKPFSYKAHINPGSKKEGFLEDEFRKANE